MIKKIKWLKICLIIEILIGLAMTSIVTMIVAVMATDSPSSTNFDMFLAGLVCFCVVGTPSILLPILSIRELTRFPERKKLIFNIIYLVLVIFFYFPVTLWHGYLLVTLKTANENNKNLELEK